MTMNHQSYSELPITLKWRKREKEKKKMRHTHLPMENSEKVFTLLLHLLSAPAFLIFLSPFCHQERHLVRFSFFTSYRLNWSERDQIDLKLTRLFYFFFFLFFFLLFLISLIWRKKTPCNMCPGNLLHQFTSSSPFLVLIRGKKMYQLCDEGEKEQEKGH